MTSIAIVDDHAVLADCLALVLAQHDLDDVRVINPAIEDPLDGLAERWPSLCLLDLDLGTDGGEGAQYIEPLVAQDVTTIVFTGCDDKSALGKCLELGASGIIAKSTPFVDVVDRIRRALDGEDINSQGEMYGWLLAASRNRSERAKAAQPFDRLTQREAEVLGALVRGLRADQIADEHCVSQRTVRTQIRSILQKLGVHSQIAAVAMAHKAGWTAPTATG